ncbi:MAG: 50S ribosomal protein L9 [Bacteroidetes bacterium]|nr:50S ribosomal protein L9 [Bacteroidota bacterium]
MEIILLEDQPNLGHKDEIVIVKDGYARNFLIPKGYAILATKSARKVHDENQRQRVHKEEKIRNEAEAMAAKMESTILSIGAKTSSKGKIFGSVNTIQIAEALAAKGFEIDRKNISLKEEVIKEIGKYSATIRLHKDVSVEIDFEIIGE